MALLYRRADVELAARDAARVFREHLRRQARAYRTAIVCLLVLLGTTLGLVWYRHFPDRRFPWTARVAGEAPSGPFTVEDQGAAPAEGVAHRWRIRIAPEQPIPRWHPTSEEQVLRLDGRKAYRLRAARAVRGVLGETYALLSTPAKRSPAAHLPRAALIAPDGVPILPEETVLLFLQWTPDVPSAAQPISLMLEELQADAVDVRSYLEHRGISIQPVYLDP